MEDRVKSRVGSQNPFYGRKHSDESKRKMSQAAKKRFEDIEKLKNIHHITIDEFLSNESMKAYLNKIILEQINKLL